MIIKAEFEKNSKFIVSLLQDKGRYSSIKLDEVPAEFKSTPLIGGFRARYNNGLYFLPETQIFFGLVFAQVEEADKIKIVYNFNSSTVEAIAKHKKYAYYKNMDTYNVSELFQYPELAGSSLISWIIFNTHLFTTEALWGNGY